MTDLSRDIAHTDLARAGKEIEHHYGPNVHICSDVVLLTLLERFGHPDVTQPELTALLRWIFLSLTMTALSRECLPQERPMVSRMISLYPEAQFKGIGLDPAERLVVINLMRGGIIPSQLVYEMLHALFPQQHLRLDHIFLNRATNAKDEVIGAPVAGHKIGGPVDRAICLIPDPMAATGSSLLSALELYRNVDKEIASGTGLPGGAKRYIALHLIVTPEYLRAVRDSFPNLIVYAARVDRGLSPKAVLESVPGTHWEQERGLNEKGYIVPGAGDIGALLNNAFV